MDNKIFEIDIEKKIKAMKKCIENDWSISNNDADILIREYRKMEKRLKKQNIMINLMALDLKNENENKKQIVEKYEGKAIKWTKKKL